MERRKINVKARLLRSDLEHFVAVWNTPLKEAVKSMDIIILLRNTHPLYRGDFASKFRLAKLISDNEAREFARIL